MLSLSRIPARAFRSPICAQCLRQLHTQQAPLPRSLLRPTSTPCPSVQGSLASPITSSLQCRGYAEKTSADDIIEEIQEQYATARDEFEIACEETEKKSVYGADDRAAAREELDRLKEMFQKALEGSDGEEVKRRVGQRIRELDNAVEALEKSALED